MSLDPTTPAREPLGDDPPLIRTTDVASHPRRAPLTFVHDACTPAFAPPLPHALSLCFHSMSGAFGLTDPVLSSAIASTYLYILTFNSPMVCSRGGLFEAAMVWWWLACLRERRRSRNEEEERGSSGSAPDTDTTRTDGETHASTPGHGRTPHRPPRPRPATRSCCCAERRLRRPDGKCAGTSAHAHQGGTPWGDHGSAHGPSAPGWSSSSSFTCLLAAWVNRRAGLRPRSLLSVARPPRGRACASGTSHVDTPTRARRPSGTTR